MKDELRFAAYAVEENSQDYLETLSGRDYRYTWMPDYCLTWIASDGTVLFDTLDTEETMENYWFYGHYHANMIIEKKYVMLYKQIIRLKL